MNSPQKVLSTPVSLDDITRLLNETAALLARSEQHERKFAPRHNVFRLLGVEHSEVRLHSRLLGDLLNPHGSHGQGGLFLRTFLELLVELDPRLPGLVEDTPRRGTWLIGTERDHIDISIRSRHHGVLIFIENKIWAGEQDNQLTRYRQLLENAAGRYETRFLIAIAPREYTFSTGPLHKCLVYETDVHGWLQDTLEHVEAEHLRVNLEQYLSIIGGLSGGS